MIFKLRYISFFWKEYLNYKKPYPKPTQVDK